jgi:hypothetical protein
MSEKYRSMIKKHPLYLILVLISTALVVFLYKAVVLDVPLISKAQTEVWHIEAHLAFIADKKPVKVSMIPSAQFPSICPCQRKLYFPGIWRQRRHRRRKTQGPLVDPQGAGKSKSVLPGIG